MHPLLLQISQHLKHLVNNSTYLCNKQFRRHSLDIVAFGRIIWNKTSRRQTLSYSRDFFGKTCRNKLILCIYDEERHSCFVYFTSHLENLILQKHWNKPSISCDTEKHDDLFLYMPLYTGEDDLLWLLTLHLSTWFWVS